MKNTQLTAQKNKIACLLVSIDENYQSVITALAELKSSKKLDLFIRKRLDSITEQHARIAAMAGTKEATIQVCAHLGGEVRHGILVTNTWISILLVDYRFRYDRLMLLAKADKLGRAHCEAVEQMHELRYIISTLQNSIGIRRTAQRIQAILAASLEEEIML